MTEYQKVALTVDQHIQQWQQRGLKIHDHDKARHYLNVISYYRLSAYTHHFQYGDADHQFKPDTKFEHILDLYIFDRELRLLVMDAIERIEVAIRSQISNVMAVQYGSHWYLDESHFKRKYSHKDLLAEVERHCQRKQENFVKHYTRKYSQPRLPPAWIVVELLTFGQLLSMYDHLLRESDRNLIAEAFNTHSVLLRSWMQKIWAIRNICAHHSRLWNRDIVNVPKQSQKLPENWITLPLKFNDPDVSPNSRIYLLLVVIEYLLQAIHQDSNWHFRLFKLMQKHPYVSKAQMGMPEDWYKDPFWRLASYY